MHVKRVSETAAVFVLAALSVFATGPAARAAAESPAASGMEDAVAGSPGYVMKNPARPVMRSPQHMLMMAYHKNVATFARLLYAEADSGAAVSPRLARVAVAEMRRSVEEMEKYRAEAVRTMQLSPQRQEMMDRHLVRMKKELRELELLVQGDRIDAAQVKKHVEPILAGCRDAGCGPMPESAGGGNLPAMPQMMMEQMLEKVKHQDEELAALVREIDQAPRDKKLDLVVETVKRMVRQRAEMTEEMQKRHDEMMQGMMPGMTDGALEEEPSGDDGER